MVVRGDSCAAIAWVFSMVPPFSKYAVMPVARKVWLQVVSGNPAAAARRLTMRKASFRVIWRSESSPCRVTERKRGAFLSSPTPAANR